MNIHVTSLIPEANSDSNPGGTLNVEVIGMLVGNFLENPKKYPDFDFKPLKIPKL